jgi:hypothetical protein
MNLADAVVLVVTMWGNNGSTWEYIGNQYVHQQPMTLVECSEFIAPKNWEAFEDNEYYKIEVSCVHIPEEKK